MTALLIIAAVIGIAFAWLLVYGATHDGPEPPESGHDGGFEVGLVFVSVLAALVGAWLVWEQIEYLRGK